VTGLGDLADVRNRESDESEGSLELGRVGRVERSNLLLEVLLSVLVLEDPSSLVDGELLKTRNDVVEVSLLDGERSSGNLCDGGPSTSVVDEVVLEERRVDGSRHEDDPDWELTFPSIRDETLEDDEKKIGVDVSLVNLVDDDVGEAVEPGHRLSISSESGLHPLEEDSGRAEGDGSVRDGRLRVESNLVSDVVSDPLSSFGGDSLGDRHGSDPPRLGTEDVALGSVSSSNVVVEDDLRDLRRLSGSRRGHADGDFVRLDLGEEFRRLGSDWERLPLLSKSSPSVVELVRVELIHQLLRLPVERDLGEDLSGSFDDRSRSGGDGGLRTPRPNLGSSDVLAEIPDLVLEILAHREHDVRNSGLRAGECRRLGSREGGPEWRIRGFEVLGDVEVTPHLSRLLRRSSSHSDLPASDGHDGLPFRVPGRSVDDVGLAEVEPLAVVVHELTSSVELDNLVVREGDVLSEFRLPSLALAVGSSSSSSS